MLFFSHSLLCRSVYNKCIENNLFFPLFLEEDPTHSIILSKSYLPCVVLYLWTYQLLEVVALRFFVSIDVFIKGAAILSHVLVM